MRRVLTPREHGAYAQLVFPLFSGLILSRPTLAAYALALAAIGIFLAYEPAAVLLGVRGVRLQRDESAAARRQLGILAPAALLFGSVALVGAPPAARVLMLVPAACCVLLVPLVPIRRVKTLAGETLVALALVSMHLPIAAAGGTSGLRLWGPAAAWFLVFFLATLAVHAIKARHKRRDVWIGAATALSSICGLLAATSLVVWVPALRTFGLVLALPLAAVVAVNATRVHPQALRRVGWTLVAADTVTLALFLLL